MAIEQSEGRPASRGADRGTHRGAPRGAPRGAVGLRLAAGSAASALVTVAMVGLGRALPHHPAGWSGLDGWVTATPIDAVAVHAAWLVGVGLGAQLTVAHLVASGGWMVRSTRTMRLAEQLSAGIVARAWTGVVLGAATATIVPAGAAVAQTAATTTSATADDGSAATTSRQDDPGRQPAAGVGDAPPQLRVLVESPAGAPTSGSGPVGADEAVPAMRLVTPAPGPSLALPGAPADVPAVAPSLGVWLVRPGDSLWQIAEAVLERGPGVRGEIDAVHDYWQRLIELNRANLADPANPDLLFSGQQLRLPPTT